MNYKSTKQRMEDRNKLQNRLMVKNLLWGITVLLAILTIVEILFPKKTDAYELPEDTRKWQTDFIEGWYNSKDCLIDTENLWSNAAKPWGVIDIVEKESTPRLDMTEGRLSTVLKKILILLYLCRLE